jgi:parallel beta-helix repeat protein
MPSKRSGIWFYDAVGRPSNRTPTPFRISEGHPPGTLFFNEHSGVAYIRRRDMIVQPLIAAAAGPRTLVAAANAPDSVRELAWPYACDGIADQEEVNAAIAVGLPVEFSTGDFTFSGPVNLADNLSIWGQDAATIIRAVAGFSGTFLFRGANIDNVYLRGFDIDGNKGAGPGLTFGVYLEFVTNFLVEDIVVEDVNGMGVSLGQSCVRGMVRNIAVLNNDLGYALSGPGNNSAHVLLDKMYLLNSGSSALYTGYCHDCWFSRLYIENPGAQGIHLHGGHVGAYGNTIERCIIVNPSSYGIEFAGEAAIPYPDPIVQGCRVYGGGSIGIRMANVVGALVTGNRVFNNDDYGIYLDGARYSQVLHNHCYDDQGVPTQTYGIRETDNGVFLSDYNTICHNTVHGNTVAQIAYIGDDIVRDNEGFVTEGHGQGTITDPGTSQVVNHGLDITPLAEEITVTLLENPTNDPGPIWVDTVGAASFTVHCRNAPGASNLDFAWKVTHI